MKLFLIALMIFLVLMVTFVGLMIGVSNKQSDLGMVVAEGLIVGVPLLVIGLVIWALRDTYKSFSRKNGPVSFGNWMLNIVPFRPIETLIRQIYPSEHVISSRLCFDGIIGFFSSGKTPVNAGYKLNFPFPAFLVETNESYYIDRRLQQILNNILLVLVGNWLIQIYTRFRGVDNPEFALKFFFYILLFVAGSQIFFALFWQVSRIDVLKKSWLTTENKKSHLLSISGTVPKGSPLSLSTDKFVSFGGISFPFKQVFLLI